MALKNQVPNVYSVGLQNAGSYQVSGQPFIARRSISAGKEVKIEFPYVTKNITIRIPSPPNAAALKEGGVFYLSTDTDYNGAGFDGQIPAFGDGSSDWTWSFWWKSPTWGKNNVIAATQAGDINGTITGKLKIGNPATQPGLKYDVIASGPTTHTIHNQFDGVTLTNGRWYQIAITQKTGSIHLYIDGYTDATGKVAQLPIESADVRFGWNGHPQIHTASFDESIFFHTGMTQTEINELYNNREWYDPRKHSLAANLTCWWTMGDDHRDKPLSAINNPGVTDDIIYDVIDSSDENVNLFSLGGSKNFEYVEGPFASQTTGKLRTYLLSTGSSPHGANIIPNKHYYEIQGYGTSIELPMKTKELYLQGVGAQVTFEVIAELTNIPNERMYALTGSGIDE